MATAEIISIGNELLLGDVLDTNSHWLCRQLTGLGARVQRVTMVRDDPAAIGEVVLGALARAPDLLLTCGGLGPTADDLTLSAIAAALHRPLILHPEAEAMVRATYTSLAARGLVQEATLTEARRKMAYLPQGAEPLHNPIGAAPGVLLQWGSTTLICLPGVPEEMKGIFTTSLTPLLGKSLGRAVFVERALTVNCGDESALAPMVDQTARHHPTVYVKSRAQPYGEGVRLLITLSASGQEQVEVDRALDAAEQELTRRLSDAGIPIVARRVI